MLLRVHHDVTEGGTTRRLENLHVGFYPEMGLFSTTLHPAADEQATTVRVTFTPPGDRPTKSIDVPLQPETTQLSIIDIEMHRSPTQAYQMVDKYNQWFTDCFGFEVILAYLGENRRPALGTFTASAVRRQEAKNGGWLSNLSSMIPSIGSTTEDEGLTFVDCAPLLVVTEESVQNVSARLAGAEADVTKFRPNVVVKNAPKAWEEDYWGELMMGPAKLHLTQNCIRCQSLDVDFKTGQWSESDSGKILKKLMKDRRVDTGAKYKPVFGRYGFLGEEGGQYRIGVGDSVNVTKRNEKLTVCGE